MMGQVLTPEEQLIWEKWVSARDAEAGNLLVKKYMPLVSYHVHRISVGLPSNVSRDDIHSLGMIGLYDALEKFDPSRDLKFDTYASFRIRGAIIDGLRKEDWLPRSAREKSKKVEAAIEKLEQNLMRNATIPEIATEVGMSEEEVYQTINEGFFANVLSMNEYQHDEEGSDKSAFSIKDDTTLTPEEHVVKKELLNQLIHVIQQLNEKEQLIISLFYKEELTLTEIGQFMGLSTCRISQIHSKPLFKIKEISQKHIH